MTFLAAGWLLLFVPLAAVAWAVCRRVVQPAATTAAWLWRRDAIEALRTRERVAWPPPWIFAALAAAASAIVALAEPTSRTRRATINVVVDPAAHLVRGGDASPLSNTWSRVRDAAGGAEVRLVVPGQPDVRSIGNIRATARSTRDPLAATLAPLVREGRPLVALTDTGGVEVGPRGILVRPAPRAPSATVALLAARQVGTATAVLVRVGRELRAPAPTWVRLRSAGATAAREIAWSEGAATAEVRLSLDAAGDRIEATLDDGPVAARLARETHADVRLAQGGPLPAFAERFATIYASERPAGPTATLVTLSGADAPGSGPRLIVAGGVAVAEDGPARRAAHPMLDAIGPALEELAPIAASPPDGFEPIAWRGDRPTVAVRDGATGRGVWIGVDGARPTAALVVLLDAAVRWAAGERGDGWSSVAPDEVPLTGWTALEVDDPRVDASPGFYRDEDGRLRAVDAPRGHPSISDGAPSSEALAASLGAASTAADRTRSRAPAIVAAACVAAATLLCGFAARRSS